MVDTEMPDFDFILFLTVSSWFNNNTLNNKRFNFQDEVKMLPYFLEHKL